MTKPTKCLIKCPACRLKRMVGRETKRLIKAGLQTAKCSFCNNASGNKIKKAKRLTCPVCKETRLVSDAMFKRFVKGETEGLCRSCNASVNNKTKQKRCDMIAVEVKVDTLKINGCTLIENPKGGRCKRFFDCRFNDDCIGVIARKRVRWEGFSSDCAGFKEIPIA